MVHQVDATRLYYHILQTRPGASPVMDCSNVATGTSFGILGPVKKTKTSVKRWSSAPKEHFVSEVVPGEGLGGLQSPSGQCILVISSTLTYK